MMLSVTFMTNFLAGETLQCRAYNSLTESPLIVSYKSRLSHLPLFKEVTSIVVARAQIFYSM
nr:MAG TPA: hypothetical protein [Caudoviricetes sp.]